MTACEKCVYLLERCGSTEETVATMFLVGTLLTPKSIGDEADVSRLRRLGKLLRRADGITNKFFYK